MTELIRNIDKNHRDLLPSVWQFPALTTSNLGLQRWTEEWTVFQHLVDQWPTKWKNLNGIPGEVYGLPSDVLLYCMTLLKVFTMYCHVLL